MTTASPRPARDWIATYDPDDPLLRREIEQSYKRFNWAFVPVFGATFVLTQVARDWVERNGETAYDRLLAAAPDWAAATTFALALALVVGSIAVGLSPARRAVVRRNPRVVLTWAQSRRVRRQIYARVPFAPYEIAFLRDVALAMYAQRWLVVAMAGSALAALSVGMFGVAVSGWLVVVPFGVAMFGVRVTANARRFLRSVGVTPV
jgi:hypothetical protein